jgi:hypothetical protein
VSVDKVQNRGYYKHFDSPSHKKLRNTNDSESHNIYNNKNFKGFLMTRSVKVLILEILEVTSIYL